MKEYTDEEFSDFVAPSIEKAREAMKPSEFELADASPTSAEETTGNAPGANGDDEPMDKPEFDDEDLPF